MTVEELYAHLVALAEREEAERLATRVSVAGLCRDIAEQGLVDDVSSTGRRVDVAELVCGVCGAVVGADLTCAKCAGGE